MEEDLSVRTVLTLAFSLPSLTRSWAATFASRRLTVAFLEDGRRTAIETNVVSRKIVRKRQNVPSNGRIEWS